LEINIVAEGREGRGGRGEEGGREGREKPRLFWDLITHDINISK